MTATILATPPATATSSSKWKTVILASLGGSLEIYDFIIYGVFAQQIAKQFFPSVDPLASLIATFSVFAIGYVSRPLGGIILSSLGDRFGRRIVFLVSVLAMSGCTIGIGLTPSYETIGVFAPILLVLLRLAQGFFLAGELPCSITYVVEEMPARASFVSGVVIFCLNSGVLIATLISFGLHSTLSPEGLASYGWRIAFLFGGLLGLISYWMRTSLEESQEFAHMKSHKAKRPFRQILSHYPLQVLIGIGAAGIVNASNTLIFVVAPSYMTSILHYDGTAVSAGQNLGIAMQSASLLFVAWWGTHFPTHLLHRFGALILALGSYPLFLAISAHQIEPIPAFLLIGLFGGVVTGCYAYMLADLFPTAVRFSGVALSLNLSTVVFTGLTPLGVTKLMQVSGSTAAPGMYLAGIALLALLAGLAFPRFGGQIRNPRPNVQGG